jgi:SAM-dependent methyltransferase
MCFPLTEDWLAPAELENFGRTCGTPTRKDFMVAGLTLAYEMYSIAQEYIDNTEDPTILDWGIGAARVAVPLKRGVMPNARVIGCDVDRVNVSWCQTNLPDIPVELCDFYPPLDLASGSVDMIYGISVMTHLTVGAQLAWLKELRRVLKPGGICVLSTHGEYALSQSGISDSTFFRQLAANGISDILADSTLGPLLEVKNYYRSTFQKRRHVEEEWSRYLRIVQYYPAAIQTHQDLVIMRKE